MDGSKPSGASDTPLSPTSRTQLRRYPDRGRKEREDLYAVLDAGLVCHVGVVVDGSPRVTPMVYGRIGDTLYLHGSVLNQPLNAAKNGAELCVTVTNVYGLVLANSLYNHSLNFRSAMIYATATLVTDEAERLAGMQASGNQLVPERANVLPEPTRKQLAGVMVLALSLAEASVKVREGPPHGEPADYDLDIWAGVLPLQQTWGEPEPDPVMRPGIPVPSHVTRLVGRPALERAQRPPEASRHDHYQ